MAGNAVLGLLIGALLPLVAVLQISMLVPVLMLGSIFAVRLKARAGWLPVGVLVAAELSATAMFVGIELVPILAAAAVLPALYVIRGMDRKQPYFEQMNGAVAAHVAGLLAAMLIAYISFGGSMVARFVDVLRMEFAQMPDAALQPFADAINSALSLSGSIGLKLYTVEMYRTQLIGVLDLMQQTYAQYLPGTLLCGAMLSGVLTALWGNWTLARQGRATNESFVGMASWFLPARFTTGALVLWVAGLLLANSSYRAGAPAWNTIRQLAGAAFAVQALAALDRRMLSAGRSTRRRRVLVTLLAVLALLLQGVGAMLGYIGAASALFGSRGAVRLWLEKHRDDHSDRDDPDL